MIKSVVLKNFRGFRDHTIDFTPFCLLIGQNNAGKTTIIEALRIASAALQKARTAKFEMAPESLEPDLTGPVYRFSLDTLDIEDRGIHYNYDKSEPAVLRFRYNNNCSIVVALGEDLSETYCQLLLPGGKKVNSRSQISPSKFRSIFVMPPVGALLHEETDRDKKYVHRHMNGYLSYRHIRNQMVEMPEDFARFKDILIDTWSSRLKVDDIKMVLGERGHYYDLTIRDGPFISEMALVGSGLQAWIQAIWFLARVDGDSTVILDEPDVYLHADLQRKLVKLLSAERYRQTIVATHSMEMISDVSPGEIVSVTKRAARSRPLSSNAQAQSVVDAIGTNMNIQLSKLSSAGKVLFVEGKDYAFLDQIAFKQGNSFYDQFSQVPHFSVGGMNNWPRAAMAAKAFHDTSSGKVRGLMFVDRDYKSNLLLSGISDEAAKDHLDLVIWPRKELENFFLDHELICSYIANRAREKIEIAEVRDLIDAVVTELSAGLQILIADSYQAADRKLALPTAMEKASDFLNTALKAGATYETLIGGKKALSLISSRSQERWSVQIGAMSLCRHMDANKVPSELLKAVNDVVS